MTTAKTAPEAQQKTEKPAEWNATANIERFASLTTAIKDGTDKQFNALDDRQQNQLRDNLADLKDENLEVKWRKNAVAHLTSKLGQYGLLHLKVQRLRSTDPNKAAYEAVISAKANEYLPTDPSTVAHLARQRTVEGKVIAMDTNAFIEMVSNLLEKLTPFDKNTAYGGDNPTPWDTTNEAEEITKE
tara:strand:+ start:10066 stop:10626 length:561 start_codon:yes stop_codon:yes gene_type:complete